MVRQQQFGLFTASGTFFGGFSGRDSGMGCLDLSEASFCGVKDHLLLVVVIFSRHQ